MIKIAAFLTNIQSDTTPIKSWHNTNIESLARYFNRYDIDFDIIDNKDKFVIDILSNHLSPNLCKIVMINRFLSTDADYGLFLNTSTNIINIHNNIQNIIDFDKQYFSRMEIKNVDTHAYMLAEQLNKVKLDFQNNINNKSPNFAIADTSFMCLSRYFCQDYIDYANQKGIDLKDKESIKNLIKYTNHQYLDDSFLLEAFVRDNYHKYNIESLHTQQINNIILNNTIGRDNITIEDIMYYYPIFFCHGSITEHTELFVQHGLLADVGRSQYNDIRQLRYAEMFYKHHLK